MSKEKGNKLYHHLDRYVGIPIVFLLGLIKKKNQKPLDIKKIAILNLGSIGDNVLMSSTISDIHKAYPDSSIHIFTGSSNYEIVKLIPYIDEITKLPISNPFHTKKIINAQGNFDLLIDFGPWPRINAIYSFLFSSNYTIGFKTKNQYREYVYDYVVEHSGELHEIDNHRNLIKTLYHGEHQNPHLNVKNYDLSKYKITTDKRIAVIHPWSAGLRKLDKQWSLKNWVELCHKINADFDYLIITGAPSDKDDADQLFHLIKKDRDNDFSILNLAGKLSLSETIYLISIAEFIFCVDTGISHIAAALNKPQICLQGPANSTRWRPYSNKAIVINPTSGSYGYISLGFEKKTDDSNCMDNIFLMDVINAFSKYKNEKKLTHNYDGTKNK